MRQFLILILIVFSISSYAQVKDSTESKKKTVQDFKNMMSPYYSYGNGLGITSPDSLYQVNIRFRMQSSNYGIYLQRGARKLRFYGN